VTYAENKALNGLALYPFTGKQSGGNPQEAVDAEAFAKDAHIERGLGEGYRGLPGAVYKGDGLARA